MNINSLDNKAPKFPEIEIYIFEYASLGGKGQWNWLQSSLNHNKSMGPYWRIYWNDTPGGFIKVDKREIELSPDKLVVLSPDTVYSSHLKNPVGHFYVHCSVGRPLSQMEAQLFELYDPDLLRLARKMADCTKHAHNDYRTLMRLHVYVYSVLLALPENQIPPYTEYDARVSLAITMLENTPEKSNRELARAVNMSTNGFIQLFQQEIGIPPQTYSRQKRLSNAATMLHHCESTIEAIAVETGFCDRYHLSKLFKKEYGMGPAEFRNSKVSLK